MYWNIQSLPVVLNNKSILIHQFTICSFLSLESMCLFQCCTWRGVGSTAGGVLRSPSRVPTGRCVNAGWAASESSSLPSVRLHSTTHRLTHTLSEETVSNDVVVVYSQQTQTPAGLHQSVRGKASGDAHLWADGRSTFHPGWHLHRRHR